MRRTALLAVVALLALDARPAAAAEEGTAGPCPDGRGVTVVVDAQELSDAAPSLRCASEAGGNGLAVLSRAGVSYQEASRSPGFVCRVAGLPADEPCTNASPADAYWSYWLAVRGGAWCLSNRGAAGRTPPAGTVEGWSFAKDRQDDGPVPPCAPPPARGTGEPAATLAPGDCDTTSQTGSPTTSTTRAAVRTATTASPAPPTTAGAGAGAPVTPATVDAGAEGVAGALTTTTVGAAAVQPSAGDVPEETTTTTTAGAPFAAGPPVTLDVAPADDSGGSGPGPAIAVVGGSGAVLAGAVVLGRRRRRAPS